MTQRSPFRYSRTCPEIIWSAVMMHVGLPLSFRNVEDLLHERRIEVSCETVRFWWHRFGPMFAADGIALDPAGEFLYWQALTGRTLYRIPTAALTDTNRLPPQLATMVERVGTTGVADGLWMDGKGRLFVTSPEDDALKLRTMDGTMTTLVQDKRLRWPDSLAEGPDGAIYVTSSHIQDMARFHEKGSTRTQPYALWKLQPPR